MTEPTIRRLDVRIDLGEGSRPVGRLADRRGRLFFEYDPAFLDRPLWLSPFELPPEPGLVEHRDRDFGPIFGLFDDSLPDGWGLLLMDRFFRQVGSSLAATSVLERLAYLGEATMGALTYHPPTDTPDQTAERLDLYRLARESDRVLRGQAEDVLPELLRAGGSPGGARPKVLVGVRGDDLVAGHGSLPGGFEPWLVKFRGIGDSPDSGAVELAYSAMARDAGILVPETRLFETSEGDRFFGIRRFDRIDGKRRHIQTLGALVHANFRVPGQDYSLLLDVARALVRTHDAVRAAFRRAAFNVFAHNRDDHVKNVSFRLAPDGSWELAPAYDLTFAHGPAGEHTMTVAGEGRRPGHAALRALAEAGGLRFAEADEILDQVATAISDWRVYAESAGVGREERQRIGRAINEQLSL